MKQNFMTYFSCFVFMLMNMFLIPTTLKVAELFVAALVFVASRLWALIC
jgi:hypothetical protein